MIRRRIGWASGCETQSAWAGEELTLLTNTS